MPDVADAANAMTDRRCGALLGLAVGDALGTTNEFTKMNAPPFPQLAGGPLTDIVGGGPFDLKAGQVTDDTQMACCLYSSLSSLGRFDVSDVAGRYVEWSSIAFDVGAQTRSALALVGAGESPREAGRIVWLASGKRAAGNGSLMRSAPIGALFSTSMYEGLLAALDDSAITHFDPRCRLACAAFTAAIATAIVDTIDPEDMRQAALAVIPQAANNILADTDTIDVEVAMSAIESDLDAATHSDPELYGPQLHLREQQGFVRVAFRLAFWELLHRAEYRDAVLDAANRGGDADTNCAIVGALVGSRVGLDGIPAGWRQAVLECKPNGSLVWSTTYHPKIFAC